MQSVIGWGIRSPIAPPAPTLRCHVPQTSAKPSFLLKRAPEVTTNSAGDKLQYSAMIWRAAACPPLELLTGQNNFY